MLVVCHAGCTIIALSRMGKRWWGNWCCVGNRELPCHLDQRERSPENKSAFLGDLSSLRSASFCRDDNKVHRRDLVPQCQRHDRPCNLGIYSDGFWKLNKKNWSTIMIYSLNQEQSKARETFAPERFGHFVQLCRKQHRRCQKYSPKYPNLCWKRPFLRLYALGRLNQFKNGWHIAWKLP